MKKYKAKISRNCIYWDLEELEWTEFEIEAESYEEAKKLARLEAIRLEISCGSKLVQDIIVEEEQ